MFCLAWMVIIKFMFYFSASANICNVALMRHNELSEGIDVLDSNGNVVGSSRIAAKHVRMLVIQLGLPTSIYW